MFREQKIPVSTSQEVITQPKIGHESPLEVETQLHPGYRRSSQGDDPAVEILIGKRYYLLDRLWIVHNANVSVPYPQANLTGCQDRRKTTTRSAGNRSAYASQENCAAPHRVDILTGGERGQLPLGYSRRTDCTYANRTLEYGSQGSAFSSQEKLSLLGGC